jgi:hypothetical protein
MNLEDLKPGDEVACWHDYHSNPHIETVDRITNTQIVIRGMKYNRSSGRRIGGAAYGNGRIAVAETKHYEAVERRSLQEKARVTRWDLLPLTTLREVSALIDAGKEGA